MVLRQQGIGGCRWSGVVVQTCGQISAMWPPSERCPLGAAKKSVVGVRVSVGEREVHDFDSGRSGSGGRPRRISSGCGPENEPTGTGETRVSGGPRARSDGGALTPAPLPNKPLQRTNAVAIRAKVGMPRRRGLRPHLLAAVIRLRRPFGVCR